ncbi:glucose-1-phosphate thymidylyltransferase, partial [Candidatus Woesearchaeota archaeon]|nr:glucose-1-phosphate thymidylyltransferase [Candidatus Woesearchaeota archaeon]
SSFGKIVAEKGQLRQISEKPDDSGSGLANTGCYVLPGNVFSLLRKLKKSNRGEYEITDAIQNLLNVAVVEAEFWQPITYPWSLLESNESLLRQREKDKPEISKSAVVEKYATLKGFVAVGKGTLVRSGAYIEGPAVIGENCIIGPNCFIRAYTSIGNNCRIGNAVEIKNSIIMDGTVIGHLSYCGDSVIGKNANFGAGTITANLRHDDGHVKSAAKDTLIDTGRRKFGTVLGDNAKTGVHTSIYPGRKIWPGKATLPGEIVTKDIT